MKFKSYKKNDFFKRSRFAFTKHTHQCNFYGRFVEILNFKIIELLCSFFICKEFNIVLYYRLVPFVNTQIKGKERSTVGKKLFGISDSVRKVIASYIRLCKGSIYKVVRCGIFALQEVFDVELIIRLKMKNLCVIKFYGINILLKFSIGVIPKHKLTNVTCELAI